MDDTLLIIAYGIGIAVMGFGIALGFKGITGPPGRPGPPGQKGSSVTDIDKIPSTLGTIRSVVSNGAKTQIPLNILSGQTIGIDNNSVFLAPGKYLVKLKTDSFQIDGNHDPFLYVKNQNGVNTNKFVLSKTNNFPITFFYKTEENDRAPHYFNMSIKSPPGTSTTIGNGSIFVIKLE